MKKIYFMRHANALNADENISDHERNLSDNGKIDAQNIGTWFANSSNELDLIKSSTSFRTKQTVENFCINSPCNEIELIDDLYLAQPGDILNIIQNLDNKYNNVMLVGHNPSMAGVAQALSAYSKNLSKNSRNSLITFMPCTLAIAVSQHDSWKDFGCDAKTCIIDAVNPQII